MSTQPKFRPFDELDWQAYAGCESDNPLIHEADDVVVVIDGTAVNVMYDGRCYAREYGNQHDATARSRVIAGHDHITHEWLEAELGKAIGGY